MSVCIGEHPILDVLQLWVECILDRLQTLHEFIQWYEYFVHFECFDVD